jgi:hypothetical protein
MVTASQTLKIYELLNKHFKTEEDAKALVQEIEQVIDVKYQSERDRLVTKEDLLKAENRIILWMVSFNTVLAGIIIALFKLL